MLVVPSTAKAHDSTGAGPKIVMYVEVNDNDINNVGKYTLVGQNTLKIRFNLIHLRKFKQR